MEEISDELPEKEIFDILLQNLDWDNLIEASAVRALGQLIMASMPTEETVNGDVEVILNVQFRKIFQYILEITKLMV